jgi:molecular chaperone DnaJ
MAKDYYKILGVEKNANSEQIKQAFRQKAHQHHPDKSGGNAEKFKELNEAYQVLGNEEKRKQYDQFGSTFSAYGGNWQDFSRGNAGFGDFSAQGGPASGWGDLGDIFSDFFGQSQRGSGRQTQAKGADLEASFTINFEEAVFGTEKILDISKKVICEHCQGNGAEPGTKIVTCKTCGGTGQIIVNQQTFFGAFRSAMVCSNCQGEGKVPEKKCANCGGSGIAKGKERIAVKVPAGINNGETIKLSDKGEAGQAGRNGDLYINIRVLPHPNFRREGDNLYTVKTINYSQAAMGDKNRVQTLDGEIGLKIPSGTPAGKQFSKTRVLTVCEAEAGAI